MRTTVLLALLALLSVALAQNIRGEARFNQANCGSNPYRINATNVATCTATACNNGVAVGCLNTTDITTVTFPTASAAMAINYYATADTNCAASLLFTLVYPLNVCGPVISSAYIPPELSTYGYQMATSCDTATFGLMRYCTDSACSNCASVDYTVNTTSCFGWYGGRATTTCFNAAAAPITSSTITTGTATTSTTGATTAGTTTSNATTATATTTAAATTTTAAASSTTTTSSASSLAVGALFVLSAVVLSF